MADDEDYGEEEFEDYDNDDFEAEEDYDVLPKAMLGGAGTPVDQGPQSPLIRPSSRGMMQGSASPASYMPPRVTDIPPAPPLTEAQMKVARKRLAAALKKWPKLSLEVVVLDEFLAMGSLSEYDLFTMGRGIYAGKKVGTAQTNDDAKEEECQTDEIDTQPYASQAPEDRNTMTEGEVAASSVAASGARASAASAAAPAAAADAPKPSIMATHITAMEPGMELKLNAFMQWAGPIMLAALGEAPNSKQVTLKPDPHGGKGLGSGIVPISYPALLANRPVNGLAFVSTAGEPLLLAAYGPMGAALGSEELLKDHTLATKGCMCLWDLSAPSTPKAVMISEGTPSCCGFASAPATHVVFAGMEEGGVCLWDLEEPASKHPMEQVGGATIFTRRPSYTSECSPDVATSGAPIVSVVAAQRAGSRSTPCYLYSLSSWGDVTIWTVNTLSKSEAAAVDDDLGMRAGSCVRLLRVAASVRVGKSALRPFAVPEDAGLLAGMVQSSAIQVLPSASRQFLVAADGGRVLKGSWVGLAPPPKEYVPHDHSAGAVLAGTGRIKMPSCVTSLHVSPTCPWAFLAGHDDGTVTLHGLGLATAALVWPGVAPGGVRVVRWSPSRPAVFFVLDRMCTLSCFDLTKNRSGPVSSQPFMAADPNHPGVASLATCMEVGPLTSVNGPDGLPGFAVGYDDGRLDFLSFAPTYTQASGDEAKVLAELVGTEPVPKN